MYAAACAQPYGMAYTLTEALTLKRYGTGTVSKAALIGRAQGPHVQKRHCSSSGMSVIDKDPFACKLACHIVKHQLHEICEVPSLTIFTARHVEEMTAINS